MGRVEEPLTGRAAGEALGALMGLAATGQRFDAAKVNGRLRSSIGRAMLRRRPPAPVYAPFVEDGTRAPRGRARTRARRITTVVGSPGRPRLAGTA